MDTKAPTSPTVFDFLKLQVMKKAKLLMFFEWREGVMVYLMTKPAAKNVGFVAGELCL